MTYLRMDASSLPGNVGREGLGGCRLSDGQSGYISYGPYFNGEPGVYVAGFYMRRIGEPCGQTFEIDVVVGEEQLARRSVPHGDLFVDIPTLVYVDFELPEPAQSVEVRLYVDEAVAVEIQSLVVFNMKPRSWGGV